MRCNYLATVTCADGGQHEMLCLLCLFVGDSSDSDSMNIIGCLMPITTTALCDVACLWPDAADEVSQSEACFRPPAATVHDS